MSRIPFEEIRDAIEEQGELTKQDVQDVWQLDDEEYREVRAWLLRNRDIESGPKRIGGFRWRERPRLENADPAPAQEHCAVADWERAGALRIMELLPAKRIEHLLERKLCRALRLVAKRRTGRDAPPRKEDLANALVVKHGRDLFCDREVRAAIADATGVAMVERWHSGKTTALEFVKAVAFPSEFAGLPSDESPPSFEYLQGRLRLRALEDFQDEVKRQLLARLNNATAERALVTLPTGAGKTRVAVETIRQWLTDRSGAGGQRRNTVVWLAHSNELCEQAHLSFKQVWEDSENACDLLLVRLWGAFTQSVDEHRAVLEDVACRPSVIITTPQRFTNLINSTKDSERAVVEGLRRAASLLVVDEAHRAATSSYRTIFERFGDAHTIGLTATPFRREYETADPHAGTKQLVELFQCLVEPAETLKGEEPRAALQRRGVLARPILRPIATKRIIEFRNLQDMDEMTDDDLERTDRALAVRVDDSARRQVLLDELLRYCGSEPRASILYFGPTVSDAECMAFLLRQAGVRAAALSGFSRTATRRKVVRDFRDGHLQVLCNCQVLTTGFDAPRVTHIMVARPTVSRVLYEQMVGRGLRGEVFGGTQECIVIDCEDDYRGARPELGYETFRHIWNLDPEAPARSHVDWPQPQSATADESAA